MTADLEAPVNIDAPTRVWGDVCSDLERFAHAWEAGPPDLAQFVPAGPPPVRRMVLGEMVKLDLERRIARKLAKPLETYLRQFPELADGGVPCDLIYEDFQLRNQAGHQVDANDYYQRFPDQAAGLARLLGETRRTLSIHLHRPPPTIAPGDTLEDFDLLAELGRGAFATVFLARQRGMQRLVALKVSSSQAAEAQTLAQLDHPHIVRVYDERALKDRGLVLVYMPYLPGGTLLDVAVVSRSVPAKERSGRTLLKAVDAALERRGELPPATSHARDTVAALSWPATVCRLGAKLASALDYAHAHGVLHRDIKPANVLLTAEGEPLIADFNTGCCSKLDGAGPAAYFGGSLGYMAVEHLEAFDPGHPRDPASLDGRADLFGLAVTLWELVTGARPFGVESLRGAWSHVAPNLIAQRRRGPSPEALAAFDEGDAIGLRAVLVRCLDADADRRPATGAEMARELELCLRPATRALVRPEPGGWREYARRHPVRALLPAGLLPNTVAAAFNIWYNLSEIIEPWESARIVFERVIPVVNAVFFSLGITVFALSLRPVVRGFRGQTDRGFARRWALRLGSLSAVICASCWLIAGVVWPVALYWLAGPSPQGAEAYLHLLVSLTACGLMASTGPYFLVTFVVVHALYPALLGNDGPDRAALARVERELGHFRVLAAAVPFVAVLLVSARGIRNPLAIVALCVAGLIGTGLAFILEGKTRADLAALGEVP